MRIIRFITTLTMTIGFGFFGSAKIAKASIVTEGDGWSRLSEGQWAAIGALELLAVAGLLLALHPKFRVVGVAAGAGLATLTSLAVVYHLVNADPGGDIAPAVLQGLVAATYVAIGRRELRSSEPATTPTFATA